MLLLLSVLSASANWLSTSGNKIVDANGKEFRLSGLAWFGYETWRRVFHGLWAANLHTVVQQIAERGFNVIRVSMAAEVIHAWADEKWETQDQYVDYTLNPDLEGKNTLEIFDIFLADCKKYNILVFPDLHSIETEGYGQNLWYDANHPVEYWLSALEWFVTRYKDDDTIIGFDVKNEPHGGCNENGAIWDGSDKPNNWKHAAELAGNRIHGVNPNLLIIVEGNACDGDTSGWWGGVLIGVKNYPVQLTVPNKVVYSPHEYGQSVGSQSWLQGGFTYDSLYKDHWYPMWLYIHEEGIAPLLIGEWGGRMEEPNLSWMKYTAQMIAKYQLHQTFWCLNPDSGDTGGLLLDDWQTWDEDKYNLVKTVLN